MCGIEQTLADFAIKVSDRVLLVGSDSTEVNDIELGAYLSDSIALSLLTPYL